LYLPVMIFTREGVHKGWAQQLVNWIPSAASLSSTGVL
jgi:hypothetical protein